MSNLSLLKTVIQLTLCVRSITPVSTVKRSAAMSQIIRKRSTRLQVLAVLRFIRSGTAAVRSN